VSATSSGAGQGKHLLGKGSVYTLGSVLQLSGAALAIPVITRLLDPAQYGTVALALTIQLFVTTLAALGVPAALTRAFFDTEEGGESTARQLIVSTAVLGLGGTALGLLTALVWAPLFVPDEPGAVLVGIAIALPGAVITASLALLRVQERPVSFISITLVANFGAQLLGIAGLLLFDRSPVAYLAGYGTAMAVAALIGASLTRAIGARPAPRPALRAALAYGLPTVPHTLSVFVLALGDRVVIQIVSGLGAVGKYQLSYAVGGLGMNFLSSLQNAWVPITFGAEEHLRWRSLAETAAMVTRLAALACGAIALLARPLLSIVAPSDYDPTFLAEITAVLALSTLPWSTYLPRSQVLFWTKHTKPLAWITPAAAILNLALVAALLPPFGLVGAGAATVLAIGFEAVAMDLAAGRVADVPWRRTAELAHYALGMALVALALALPASFAGDAVRVALAALTGLALVAVVVREVAPRRAAAAAARLRRRSGARTEAPPDQ
jgi:O-antigen/teichoic acid export membrane protein